jgi:hypothetical protein
VLRSVTGKNSPVVIWRAQCFGPARSLISTFLQTYLLGSVWQIAVCEETRGAFFLAVI